MDDFIDNTLKFIGKVMTWVAKIDPEHEPEIRKDLNDLKLMRKQLTKWSEKAKPSGKERALPIQRVSGSVPNNELKTPHKFIQLASDISLAYIKMDNESLKGITSAFNELQETFIKEFGGNDR